jgi:hypothetical protein
LAVGTAVGQKAGESQGGESTVGDTGIRHLSGKCADDGADGERDLVAGAGELFGESYLPDVSARRSLRGFNEQAHLSSAPGKFPLVLGQYRHVLGIPKNQFRARYRVL